MALLSGGLLPASFRGVAFATIGTQFGGGRRLAVHVYPGRDEPWAEDMGRAPRSFRLRGFLLEDDQVYVGGPVALQRLLLNAALEKSGSGILTHPTLGLLQVSVRGFSVSEELDAARRSIVEIEFVESGKQQFPTLLISGSSLLSALAQVVTIGLDLASAATAITATIGGDAAASTTGNAYAQQVVAAGADATAVMSLAAQLPGNNGRYARGANAGLSGSTASPYAADTDVRTLVVTATEQREAVAAAAADVATALAVADDAASFTSLASTMTALVTALVSACANPGDAVRLLIALIEQPPTSVAAASAPGVVIVMAFRRAACFALGQACAAYQPSSYDDAQAVLGQVGDLVDEVAVEAADVGDDRSFAALRALRVEIFQDLRGRGANLAPIRTFTVPAPLPALVLAQRFYRDPSRADELLGQCPSAPNPLFMPLTIQALAA